VTTVTSEAWLQELPAHQSGSANYGGGNTFRPAGQLSTGVTQGGNSSLVQPGRATSIPRSADYGLTPATVSNVAFHDKTA